jgi:uncharacterized protein
MSATGKTTKIIDFRVRPEIEEFASITNNPIFRSYAESRGYELPRRGLEDLIAAMDANGIELDIPVVLTSGWAYRMPGVIMDDAAPRHIDRVATDLPELKIVMSHGGYPWVREMIIVAYRHRNVYFEWSGMERRPWSHEYVEGVNDLVRDKALFASAFPFFTFDVALERYASLAFKPEVRPKVMGTNAARLLKLPDVAA